MKPSCEQIRVPKELVDLLRDIAEKEQRTLVTVTTRVIKLGLMAMKQFEKGVTK